MIKIRKGFFDNYDVKLKEAIEFIQEHEPPEGYYLGDSGGKDSTVTRHLAILAKVNFQSYYSCTRIDPPEVVKFIKENHSDTIFLFPKITYWHGILTKFPPQIRSRWCCDTLKKNPGKLIQLKHRLFGIRAEESSGRMSRGKISQVGKRPIKQIHYHPIFDWSEYDIWTHIETYNLPYCKLYDEGWHRIGCLCCPFASYAEHRRNKLKYPGIYLVFEKTVKQRWEDFKSKGKSMYNNTANEYLEQWYKKGSILFLDEEKRAKGFGL
jgi:phosphoadenosine phosphosulfate reductase